MIAPACCCPASLEPPSQRIWLRLAIAWVCAGQSMMLSLSLSSAPPEYGTPVYWGLHALLAGVAGGVLLLLGKPLWVAQLRAMRQRRITTEALFALSTVGALGASLTGTFTGKGGVYYELVAIVLSLYVLGQQVQAHARGQAQRQAAQLRGRFDQARRVDSAGQTEWVDVGVLQLGDTVLVKAGEAVPVDGRVIQGQGLVNETIVSGELEPAAKGLGALVYAGSYGVDGALWVRVQALKGARVLDAVLTSVEQARLGPSKLQALGDRLVSAFVPGAVLISVSTFGFWLWVAGWTQALLCSMAVLLVACPCAFGLATPLAVWRGLIALAQRGIVPKSGRLLDVLAGVTHVIWDKTGTLSEDDLKLTQFRAYGPWDHDRRGLERLLLALEQDHPHPIARALKAALSVGAPDTLPLLKQFKIHPAQGIEGTLEDAGVIKTLRAGSLSLMPLEAQKAFEAEPLLSAKRRVYVSVDGAPAALLTFEETLRPEAIETLKTLKGQGIELHILSGDPNPSWANIAGVPVQGGLTPDLKREAVRHYAQAPGACVVFVGDGLNDLAAMSESAASLAMGSSSALTQEHSMGVLLAGRLDPLPEAITLAKRTYQVVRRNLRFALLYNCVAMLLAACGQIHPIAAALLMVGSSLVVCVSSLRLGAWQKGCAG